MPSILEICNLDQPTQCGYMQSELQQMLYDPASLFSLSLGRISPMKCHPVHAVHMQT
uniref:Uncharacterized protein n=1 Tax=Rhizophora mucronata TaxID=61149 RepID=A0A2P2IHC9_RHIMU